MSKMNNAINWWNSLNDESKKYWFDEYCNRFTRNISDITKLEIKEIWNNEIKK